MTITNASLTRAAGLCAAAAGLIFIGVQINHPAMDVSSVVTDDWFARSIAKSVMAALALVGITGMYLRQVRETRLLGLIGYLLFAMGYLLTFSVEIVAAFVLPAVAHAVPGFVDDVVVTAAGGSATGDIGRMGSLLNLGGVGFMLGGLLFGIALFRARILARWAAVLLSVATISVVSLAFLPESFNRPMAVPTGIALIGLGISLWREQRTDDAATSEAAHGVEIAAAR